MKTEVLSCKQGTYKKADIDLGDLKLYTMIAEEQYNSDGSGSEDTLLDVKVN